MRSLAYGLALSCLVCACIPSEKARDYGDPTSLSTPTLESGITAWVEAPLLTEELDSATPEIVIGAYSYDHAEAGEEPVARPMLVELGRVERSDTGADYVEDLRPAVAEGEPGPDQRFHFQMPLTHGLNRIVVRIQTADHARVRRLSFSLEYDGTAPGITLEVGVPTEAAMLDGDVCKETTPMKRGVTNARRVCVRGRVTTNGKTTAELSLGLAGYSEQKVAVGADGRFQSPLTLPENRDHVIEARVTDSKNRATLAEVAVREDEVPPVLTITSHSRETSADSILVEGTAKDEYGLDALEIQNADGAVQSLTLGATFSATVRLGLGENDIDVVARDLAGNEAREPLVLSRLRTLWLGAPTEGAGATDIKVDRFDLTELLTEQDQKDLSIADIDLEPAVKEALAHIREPELYHVDTSAWGAPEFNLQRILTMTPDTAELSGTSMEKLVSISDAIGLPKERVLAQILDLDVTEPFIDRDVAAQVLMDLLVGTHPNVHKDAQGHYTIDVSMYDVFQDMKTIAPRFGPVGDHPGFLEGESYSAVLEPGFLLTLPVASNLVQYDAIDLSRAAKDFLFILHGDRVLDFNVLTDDFNVVGLTDEPTVDLRFGLKEHPGPGMRLAGKNQTANPDADHAGFYRGNGGGFDIPTWLFEHIAAESGYREYRELFATDAYQRTLRYDTGSIQNAAVVTWNRGWVSITTAGGIGDPPPPLYAWDLLMEVAQVRLHDSGLSEGQANMAFALEDLSIGLTADQLVEKLRPKLHEQEAELSKLFVGDLGLASPRADVFYVPAEGKEGALLFRAKADSEADYTYPKPGFYSDEKLTIKVSTLEAVGGVADDSHEKVVAKLGATYYVCDEQGSTYALDISERKNSQIGVNVRKVEAIQ
jgi:hypothetical protein